MPFVSDIPQHVLKETFTHKGWLAFCPVYIGEKDEDLVLSERNGIPEWLFFVAVEFQQLLGFITGADGFLVKVTGEL
jgi:hypothetical protein